jgi:hypothetical protein
MTRDWEFEKYKTMKDIVEYLAVIASELRTLNRTIRDIKEKREDDLVENPSNK